MGVRISGAASLLAALFVGAFTAPALAQTNAAVNPTPPATAPADATASAGLSDQERVDRGKRIYTGNCARCHGLNMVNTGAGFFDLRTFPVDDKPRFLSSVTNGKRAMPAWGEKFKPEEIDLLWAYVTHGRLPR